MKNIEEIKKTPGMIIKKQGKDGFGGTVFPIEYKNGKVKIKDYTYGTVWKKEAQMKVLVVGSGGREHYILYLVGDANLNI